MIKYSLIILVSFNQILSAASNLITIQTHKWCSKSLSALKIIKKAENIYSDSLKFQYIVHDNKNLQGQTVFPKITISCDEFEQSYENQLTFVEFQYWLHINCLKKVPQCHKNSKQSYLKLKRIPEGEQLQQLLKQVQSYPSVKICKQDMGLELNMRKISKTLKQLRKLPHFTRLSHNIRNQLMIHPQKICIIQVYKEKANQIQKSKFSQIINMIRSQSKKLGYRLSESTKNRIIFVSDKSDNKIVKKLYSFISKQNLNDIQLIAFGFSKDKQLWYREYLGQIDNQFIFWIQNLLNGNKQAIKHREICLSNKIQHKYSIRSLKSIEINMNFTKYIIKVNPKIQVVHSPKIYQSKNQFKICIAQQTPYLTNSLDQLIQIVDQKFGMRNQSEQHIFDTDL